MFDRLIETGTCYGVYMNVEKVKVMEILRQQSPAQIMTAQTRVECEKFQLFV
jgi:hypothetical protein